MRKLFLGITLVALCIMCSGCEMVRTFTGDFPWEKEPAEAELVGGMTTQDGTYVIVYKDHTGEFYYHNGAKVYVNYGQGAAAPIRPTHWRGDY